MPITERNISSFFKRHQVVIVSALLALYSLHLSLTYKKEVPRGAVVYEAVSFVITPIQRAAIAAQKAVKGLWTDYVFLVGTADENTLLKSRILSLENENMRLNDEVLLGRRLKSTLEFMDDVGFNSTAARLTGVTSTPWTRTVTINKGASSGLGKDMAVISASGAVGRIIETASNASTVLLLTDARSDIDVYVERTRIKAVIEGSGEDSLILKYIRIDDDVALGDVVITSGLTGIFPRGVAIGEVVRIEKSRDNFFKYIEVKPKVQIKTLEEVIVVTD
ncbi:MAG: rod shape-determining protein MreC [Deltaproteobacteria bacterium]